MAQEEMRPVVTGTHSEDFNSRSIVSKACMCGHAVELTDATGISSDQIQVLTRSDPNLAAVWDDGYLWGRIHGSADERQKTAEQPADLVARRLHALELAAEHDRKLAKLAARFIDTEKSRNAAKSGYIPMRRLR